MRILVVEDERALCDAIARSLRNLAYSVDCCYDGSRPSICSISRPSILSCSTLISPTSTA